MKKTTVMIDERLIHQARQALGSYSIKDLVEMGLRNLVKQQNREALRKELGTFDLDLTPDELEQLRAAQ
jgi:Arc/MetJ family transcription regulator